MKRKKISFSLRYKLLLILTTLPLVSLLLYLFMATQLFEKDKLAYVFDSSVTVARSLSTQVRLQVDSALNKVKPIIENYNYSEKSFSQISKNIFLKQEKLEALIFFRKNGSSYQELGALKKDGDAGEGFVKNKKTINLYRDQLMVEDISLNLYKETEEHVIVSHRVGEAKSNNHIIFVLLYRSVELVDAFRNSDLYLSFLIRKDYSLAIGPGAGNTVVREQELANLFTKIKSTNLPEGTGEALTEADRYVLVSYSDTGVGNMFVASIVPKDVALKAVEMLIIKSLLFFVALISSTVIISVFASVRLTATIRELYSATKKIAKGDFNIHIKSQSNDEVGGLAESFTWMAGEVSRLLSETAEKARMENELGTVKAVQETLFPPLATRYGPVNIVGHFEPASECGGDWFSYSQIGDYVYLWIGDATGHGAPAALITSAAKSASSIIEKIPGMTPGKALEIMNQAIHETAKGKVLMTFFLGAINIETGELVYANASHDPPYLIRPKDGKKLSKKDLIPLMDVNGTRLGDCRGATYEEATVQLQSGDSILFYTDGIVDLEDASGKAWGERKFLKTIIDSSASGSALDVRMEYFKDQIQTYRGEHLVDDITLFMCQYKESA